MSKIGVAAQTSTLEDLVDADLDALATALYVRIDDWLKRAPARSPWRPPFGIGPQLSDAESLPWSAEPKALEPRPPGTEANVPTPYPPSPRSMRPRR